MTGTRENDAALRVLIVEDSEEQAALLRKHFERAGCVVTSVASGEDAVAAYRAQAPDLAIIDLVLPGMSGFDLVTLLRSGVPACKITITSVLDPSRFPPADAILPKPFTGAQILAVLDAVLPGRRTK